VRARLRRTDLCAADLSQAWLDQVDLTEADLTSAFHRPPPFAPVQPIDKLPADYSYIF
jgi:hypothetical protein